MVESPVDFFLFVAGFFLLAQCSLGGGMSRILEFLRIFSLFEILVLLIIFQTVMMQSQ